MNFIIIMNNNYNIILIMNNSVSYPNPEVIITGDKKFIKHFQQRRVYTTDIYSTITLWQENGWSFYNEHKEAYYSILQFVKVTGEYEPVPLSPDIVKKENTKCHIM